MKEQISDSENIRATLRFSDALSLAKPGLSLVLRGSHTSQLQLKIHPSANRAQEPPEESAWEEDESTSPEVPVAARCWHLLLGCQHSKHLAMEMARAMISAPPCASRAAFPSTGRAAGSLASILLLVHTLEGTSGRLADVHMENENQRLIGSVF